MQNRQLRISKMILIALMLLIAIQNLYYYNLLPERTAIHFSGSEQPNGWASPLAAVSLNLAISVFIAAIFLVIGRILRRVPDDMINLPHREYWLAPQRRQQTVTDIQVYLLWYADATLLFMLTVFQWMFWRNLSQSTFQIWWPLGIFLGFTAIWIWAMFRHFRIDRNNLSITDQ